MNHYCQETTGEFLEIMYSHRLFHWSHVQPRISSNTATLIDDVIFANNINNLSVSGLILCDTSDHLPILTLLLDQTKNYTCLSSCDKSANNVAN